MLPVPQLDGIGTKKVADILTKYTDDVSGRIFAIVGDSSQTQKWTPIGVDGLTNVVDKASINSAESLATEFPEVMENTFQVLEKMTVPWRQEAMNGVAILLKYPNQDLARLNRLIGKTGGNAFGHRMFHLIEIADSKQIDGLDKLFTYLTQSDDFITENIKGTFHVLDTFDRQLLEIQDIEEFIEWNHITKLEDSLVRGGSRRVYDAVIENGNDTYRIGDFCPTPRKVSIQRIGQ